MSRDDVVQLLYIVAFSMFIAGLHMLRGPRTAVRGNQVAAVGMAIAVIFTLRAAGTPTAVPIATPTAIRTQSPIWRCSSVAMTAIAMPTAATWFPRTAVRGPRSIRSPVMNIEKATM